MNQWFNSTMLWLREEKSPPQKKYGSTECPPASFRLLKFQKFIKARQTSLISKKNFPVILAGQHMPSCTSTTRRVITSRISKLLSPEIIPEISIGLKRLHRFCLLYERAYPSPSNSERWADRNVNFVIC